MPKISFRIVSASRESISHVQTGAARKPNRCAICVRGVVLAFRTQHAGISRGAMAALVTRTTATGASLPRVRVQACSDTGTSFVAGVQRLGVRGRIQMCRIPMQSTKPRRVQSASRRSRSPSARPQISRAVLEQLPQVRWTALGAGIVTPSLAG